MIHYKRQLLFLAFLSGSIFQAFAQKELSNGWLDWEVVYSSMPWYNLDGGTKTGFAYIDNADITATVNLDKLFGFEENFSVFVYGLGNNGELATDLMGDFQVASNIEATPSWRIFECWVQKNFFNDSFSLLAGLYDLNSEFDVLDPGTLFIHSSFGIGAEYAQSGLNGPSIFPVSSAGLRLTAQLGDNVRIKVAALDGVPGEPNNLRSNQVNLSLSQGALLAGEASIYTSSPYGEKRMNFQRAYETRRRKVGRQLGVGGTDKINLGAWSYTSRFGVINDSTKNAGANWGAYVGYQRFFQLPNDETLSVFARVGWANERFNRYVSAISGGLVFSSPFTNRSDKLGLAFSSGINGSPFMELQPSGERAETAIEMTYSLPVADWLLLQPDVQYIINPSTRPGISNAFAVAMLVQLSFSQSSLKN